MAHDLLNHGTNLSSLVYVHVFRESLVDGVTIAECGGVYGWCDICREEAFNDWCWNRGNRVSSSVSLGTEEMPSLIISEMATMFIT